MGLPCLPTRSTALPSFAPAWPRSHSVLRWTQLHSLKILALDAGKYSILPRGSIIAPALMPHARVSSAICHCQILIHTLPLSLMTLECTVSPCLALLPTECLAIARCFADVRQGVFMTLSHHRRLLGNGCRMPVVGNQWDRRISACSTSLSSTQLWRLVLYYLFCHGS